MTVATLDSVSYWYPGATSPALDAVSMCISGGLTLVAGPSGGGKSTFLRTLNGLVPHFHGGRIRGSIISGGLDVVATPTRQMARHVGFVFQDPESQFVYGTVEREVAFSLENIGVPRAEMADLVGQALTGVGAIHLRHRRIDQLSGGERQRVAVAGAMCARPGLLVLDEPTSQLDDEGARMFLDSALTLANRGGDIVVSEHRLERLLPACTSLVILAEGAALGPSPARDLAASLQGGPAVVRLGRRLGWDPLALTVEEARQRMPPLGLVACIAPVTTGPEAWSVSNLVVGHHGEAMLDVPSLGGAVGEIVVLMGDNGSGKTTLLRVIAGLMPPLAGSVSRRRGRVAYLPQDPSALLHRQSVLAEVELTLGYANAPEPAGEILRELGLEALAHRYPRDLSTGQQQRTAIAAVLAGSPRIVLLDEPTRGMDDSALRALTKVVRGLADGGTSVVIATHDSELAAIGDRVIRVQDGRAVDLGPAEIALSGPRPWATQIGQMFPGGPITVEGLVARL